MSSRVKALLFLLLWCHIFLIKRASIVSLNLALNSGKSRYFRNRSVEISFLCFYSSYLLFFSCHSLALLCHFSFPFVWCFVLNAGRSHSMLCALCFMQKITILSEIEFTVLLIQVRHLSDAAICNDLRPFFWLALFASDSYASGVIKNIGSFGPLQHRLEPGRRSRDSRWACSGLNLDLIWVENGNRLFEEKPTYRNTLTKNNSFGHSPAFWGARQSPKESFVTKLCLCLKCPLRQQ